MLTAVALCLLALVDAAFSGFRAFAGRDGRIEKFDAKRHAALVGVVAGVAALLLLAVVLLVPLALDWVDFDEFEEAGRRMLMVYAVYAAAITAGFAAYFARPLEVRSLGTVLLLGPGTFVRPLVILGGAVFAGAGSQAITVVCAIVAAVTMLSIERALSRWFAARLASHPFATPG